MKNIRGAERSESARRAGVRVAVAGGLVLAALAAEAVFRTSEFPRGQAAMAAAAGSDAEAPEGRRLERLEGIASDQAHAMTSVAYHFNNLWFAAAAQNWPLADFYWKETRSHLRWAVRIIPVRKDSVGRDIQLQQILDSLEQTPMAALRAAIDRQDGQAFETAYRATLEGCYACHKASEKPYLRLKVPDRPAEPLMEFSPSTVESPASRSADR